MTADPAAFRDATRGFAGCVSVLTAAHGGARAGLIVMSTLSLSADPPRLLACVNPGGGAWPLIERSRAFGWSMLAADQIAVAERFARAKGEARFEGADWETGATGAPLLAGAAATYACTVDEILPRGPQAILIGLVQAVAVRPDAGAVLWWQGGFRQLPA